MRASWLSWLPKTGTDSVHFLSAARKMGILLKVTEQALEKMSWKDEIYYVRPEKKKRGGMVFCRFPITRVSGLTREASDAVRDLFDCSEVDAGGAFVRRSGVDIMEGGTWSVSANLQDFCALLRDVSKRGIEVGKLSVGCYKDEFVILDIPWPQVTEIAHGRGFAPFDSDLFNVHLSATRQTKGPILLPHRYVGDAEPSQEQPGNFQWVDYYADIPEKTRALQLEMSF